MVEVLSGHDLLASAPSWDGKWLSTLLRAAGLPRHALRVRRTDEAIAEVVVRELASVIPPSQVQGAAAKLIVAARFNETVPEHRALPDAAAERKRWLTVMAAARAITGAQPVHD